MWFEVYWSPWIVCLLLFIFFLVEDAQLTPLLRLGAGACAGIIAMSATYPMDMVRGRITVQVLQVLLDWDFIEVICLSHLYLKHDMCLFCPLLQTDKSPYQYRGMFHALSTVLREEGFRALYKGWLPSVIGVVSSGILYMFLVFINTYSRLLEWIFQHFMTGTLSRKNNRSTFTKLLLRRKSIVRQCQNDTVGAILY